MPNIKWTYEKLLEEARRYETKQEFRAMSGSAYAAAKYRKIIDDVCAHMTPPRTSWTDEMLAAEAKKYKTKTDFLITTNLKPVKKWKIVLLLT